MEIWVDSMRCDGCGRCEEVCPNVFLVGDDFAEILAPAVPLEDRADCRMAIRSCPKGAIIIRRKAIGQWAGR